PHQSYLLAPDATPLSVLREAMPLEQESRVRGILGSFLFRGDDVDKPIRVLSGGERARVVLARMLAQPQNLLLLDEPTNHLDLQARSVLESALDTFEGSVVIVSHDRYFINRIAKRIVEIQPGGSATSYLGDYDYYAWKKEEASERAREFATSAAAEQSDGNGYEDRKKRKREREKAERELSRLESDISTTESRIAEIDDLMCDEAVFSDSDRVAQLSQEREAADRQLLELYESWEHAQSVLERT
ncbi:MAG: ATP-binding cassette domain-containing protein, partial [Myxococcota bacterium]